jgi:hypothetical protein
MNEIDPEMLAQVLAEVEAEKGNPENYTVHIFELLGRLVQKGYEPHAAPPATPDARTAPRGRS